MKYEDLSDNQKRWYNAMWDESGGDTSPTAIALRFPEPTPPVEKGIGFMAIGSTFIVG